MYFAVLALCKMTMAAMTESIMSSAHKVILNVILEASTVVEPIALKSIHVQTVRGI